MESGEEWIFMVSEDVLVIVSELIWKIIFFKIDFVGCIMILKFIFII